MPTLRLTTYWVSDTTAINATIPANDLANTLALRPPVATSQIAAALAQKQSAVFAFIATRPGTALFNT
jgi:hypothetical protein